jgi:pyruvate dehydrogenase E2 component (dihydrolipoamide acetyltransferase)
MRIGCWDVASRRASEAPPLVLLHGIGADRREWILSMPQLSYRRRVLAFDLPGHGLSDPPDASAPIRIRTFADAVVGAIEASGTSRVDLLGHSLGGAIALDLVRRYPRLVRRLVLVSAAGLPPALALSPLALSLPFLPNGFADSRRLLAATVRTPLYDNALVAFAASVYKRRRARAELTRLLAAIASGDDCLSPKELRRIAHPTLLLWGDADGVFPVAAGRRFAEALPRARLEVMPRCGHVPPTERPIAFSRRVLAFLEEERPV